MSKSELIICSFMSLMIASTKKVETSSRERKTPSQEDASRDRGRPERKTSTAVGTTERDDSREDSRSKNQDRRRERDKDNRRNDERDHDRDRDLSRSTSVQRRGHHNSMRSPEKEDRRSESRTRTDAD